ncbi:MAG TPA: ATP-binding cassette domain-containing protein, partial [Hyphomicrobium sp.]|nr:ATP-binding cassette domain-containing protein [Hyphomicrobium sp.]
MEAALEIRSAPPAETAELLRLTGAGKQYGPVTVLRDVNLSIHGGEIHAIIGENGAGKSTLMRLISGHIQPSFGTINYLGEDMVFHGPADAERRGIVLVHQEILLAEDLTVVENLFLGREVTRHGVIDDRTMEQIAIRQLAALGCTARPWQLVRELS